MANGESMAAGAERLADNPSWEDKVLERLRKRVAQLADAKQAPRDLGWEAAGFEVLRNHSRAATAQRSG